MGWYRTGTVNVTNGSANIIGVGTSWAALAKQGDGFVGPDGKPNEVLSVTSNTAITLARPYEGSTATGQLYSLFPTQGYVRDLALAVSTLINEYAAAAELKNGEYVSPEQFEGVGDGVALDGPAVVAALATGKHVRLNPTKRYNITGYTLAPVAGQKIFGGGELLKTGISTGGEAFIAVNGVANVKIHGIKFRDTRSSGARSYGVTVLNAVDTRIIGCEFSGYETPVFIWRLSQGTQVIGNQMNGGDFGVAAGGDAVGNTDGPVTNTVIAHNMIRGMRGEGIDLNWDVQGCKVLFNHLLGCGAVDGEEDIDIGGGVCRDIEVIGNVLDSGGNCARNIWIKLNTQRVTISKNTLRGATVGGILAGTAGAALQHIWITDDNKIDGGGVATGRGIELNDCVHFKASRNLVWGFGGDAITALATCSDGEINENYATDCDDGIVCLAPRTRITGNHSYLNDRVGINLQAVDLTCYLNHIRDNGVGVDGSYGLVLSAGSDRTIVAMNKVLDTRTGSMRQNGIIATGPSADVLLVENIVKPVKTTAYNGMQALTNSIIRNNLPTAGEHATVADDAVITLTPPNGSGYIDVWAETSTTHFGKRFFRVGGSPGMVAVHGGAAFASTTGALAGTTGADGNLTVSAKTDGTIDIENRSGASRVINWRFEARAA